MDQSEFFYNMDSADYTFSVLRGCSLAYYAFRPKAFKEDEIIVKLIA